MNSIDLNISPYLLRPPVSYEQAMRDRAHILSETRTSAEPDSADEVRLSGPEPRARRHRFHENAEGVSLVSEKTENGPRRYRIEAAAE